MKVTFNIECTPEEARSFMGLPDVQPMQNAMMQQVEQNMRGAIQAMFPMAQIGGGATSMPMGLGNIAEMQKAFWGQWQKNLAGLASMTGNMCLPMRKTGS